ncbi:MAG: phage tail protein [Thermoanaerobacteraceae bacterium]|nr:phage tail protein [Thermoanaerobacteraceae bacterium]
MPITICSGTAGKSVAKATWTFYDAWPSKYVLSDFNASESAVLIETLELAYEGFLRSK